MGLLIQYKLKEGVIPDKDTIKTCDDGAKGMQDVLVEISKIAFPKLSWLIWIITRFYKRTITKDAITYNFYLFLDKKTIKKKPCDCICHTTEADNCMMCNCRDLSMDKILE